MPTLAEILAAKRAASQVIQRDSIPYAKYHNSNGQALNSEQSQAVDYALAHKSFCLIGAAGTGKTTTVETIAAQLVKSGLPRIPDGSTSRNLSGKYSILFCAFTNRAVRRLRQCLPQEFQQNALTIHKALEYQRQKVSIINEEGLTVDKSVFLPLLHAKNQETHLQIVVMEEASMNSVELHQQVIEAFPNAIFIYLGDLNQLKPVYGASILGYKLTHLPVVELGRVYRQGLGSPIVDFAHKIKEGKALDLQYLKDICASSNEVGQVKITKIDKRVDGGLLAKVVAGALIQRIRNGSLDFTDTQILCPFNKGFGGIEINNYIADALAKDRNSEVWEVHSGLSLRYFSCGDRVIFNKREYLITEIKRNAMYAGKKRDQLRHSLHLDRWGYMNLDHSPSAKEEVESLSSEDFLSGLNVDLSQLPEEELSKRQASHILTLELDDPYSEFYEEPIELKSSGEIAELEFAYCITVHKAQGSEWKNVILLLHHTHAAMLSRELLYTAVTRASQCIEIITEVETLCKTPTVHAIKGDTLKAKLQYFSGEVNREKQRGIDPILNKRILS